MSKINQEARVLDYMATRGGITQLEALRDIGVARLASRISSLRKDGWPIAWVWEHGRNRYGEKYHVKRYFLEDGEYVAGTETDAAT